MGKTKQFNERRYARKSKIIPQSFRTRENRDAWLFFFLFRTITDTSDNNEHMHVVCVEAQRK